MTTFIATARSDFLDTVAFGSRSFTISGQPVSGDFLQFTTTKTNGENLTLSVTNTTPPVSVVQLTRQLLSLINAAPALQSDDGLYFGDSNTDGSATNISFVLYARAAGLKAAQIQVEIQASPSLTISPPGGSRLDQSDWGQLQPRNHLHVTAGVTNLTVTFAFDTTILTDGVHELTAVAYEGSHVRTQTRASQTVRVQNTTLNATLIALAGGQTEPLKRSCNSLSRPIAPISSGSTCSAPVACWHRPPTLPAPPIRCQKTRDLDVTGIFSGNVP